MRKKGWLDSAWKCLLSYFPQVPLLGKPSSWPFSLPLTGDIVHLWLAVKICLTFLTDANYLVYVFVCLYFWALGGTGSNVVDEDDKHVNNIKNINRLILVKRHFLPLSLELAYLIVITMAQSATLHPSRVAQFAATASQFNYTSKCDLQHCKKTIDVRCLATFLLLYHNVLIQIKFTLSWYLL